MTRESPTMIPDSYRRDLKTGQLTKLTSNVDYTPEFTRLVRKKVTVTRAEYEYTDQAGYDRTLRTENLDKFPTARRTSRRGVAGGGMYNRTLTPNGFQSERRDFWEAQQTYVEMSPFFEADKLTGALLMYHSLEDQNVGTDPISSVRMLHALQGLGKTAALYMYPYEDHGPAARETLLDQWARWTAWLDLYVKNAKPGAVAPAPAAPVTAEVKAAVAVP